MAIPQELYLVVLLLCCYGVLKSVNVYKEKRQFKYLVILAFFIIALPQVWMRAYDVNAQEFLATFQLFLTLIPLALFLVYDYWERKRIAEEKDKIKIKTFFERYVNQKIVDELLEGDKLELKGKSSYITVFFMDVRGFTKLSEKLPAEKVVALLNHYFNIATSSIFKYDGTVDKFVGDAVMAIFNAPTDVKDHELKAVKAAIEIQKRMQEWGKLKVGIGIHAGVAVVGNIGSSHMMDYTVIGDTVNIAARLEGQTKAGDVCISKTMYDKVKKDFPNAKKETVMVKGKSQPIEMYRYKV